MICFHLISKFVLPLLSLNSLAGKPRVRFCTLRSSQVLQSKKKTNIFGPWKENEAPQGKSPQTGDKIGGKLL